MTDYERYGEYQPSGRSTFGTALTFLLIGLGVGSLTALLLAPQSGQKTRRMLRRRAEEAYDAFSDRADEWVERGTEIAGRARDFAETAREKVEPLVRGIRK